MSDTDGDGVPDSQEVNLQTHSLYDRDNDRRPDILDVDDDGDGIPTIFEGTDDVDKDGLANYLDPDSDGDGVLDGDEVRLTHQDADRDRVDDRFDADIHTGADKNGDGILDSLKLADANNNGVPDFLDRSVSIALNNSSKPDVPSASTEIASISKQVDTAKAPRLISKSDDTDSDGLPNAIELALGLNPMQADSDGDGLNDALEIGVDPKKPQDSDLDGVIDALDQDDDNDGIPTKREVTVSKKLSYKLDTDKDGVFNYLDANDDGDSRLSKVEGASSDYDRDGIPDYLDRQDGISIIKKAKVVILHGKSATLADRSW